MTRGAGTALRSGALTSTRALTTYLHVFQLVAGSLAMAASPAAGARPLKLNEIKALGDHVACTDLCPAAAPSGSYDLHLARVRCLAGCGEAPRLWEKDGVPPITRSDHELALLEYVQTQDPTRPLICYADVEQTVVVPGALCSGPVCQQQAECTPSDCAKSVSDALECTDDPVLGPVCWWPDGARPAACPDIVCTAQPTRTIGDCLDDDGDGLPAWLEAVVPGFDAGAANAVCSTARPCAITDQCVYSPELGTGLCKPRVCNGTCTAFHLELVAQDDREVIVHLHYDYTPVPARVLNLYLTYPQSALTLQDARALEPLRLFGKQLATTHLSSGTLRLTVFDPAGTEPIPVGPIVELVFRRQSTAPATIAFAEDDALQTEAVAPLHGSEAALADDALWGSPIELKAASDATTQLSVWYDFESLATPIALTSAPSATALCGRVSECALETDPVRKARLVARLTALQSGPLVGGAPIAGISGAAVWLDGSSNHLQLPIDFRDPLAPIAQSVSAAGWFFAEGASSAELKTTPQVVFAHMGYGERTRFALLLRPEPGGKMRLTFLDGDLLQTVPAPAETTIVTGIALRTWHHLGLVVDAAQGKAELYFDGARVKTIAMTQPPAVTACPQFFAATDVVLHDEGDVVGGKPPEDLFVAAYDSGTWGLSRVSPAGTGRTPVIDDAEFNYKDPDFSPLLGMVLYSANVSGSYEIWVSDAAGGARRQLTTGFGDASLGFAARHPRWAPDGSGLVFESGAFDVLQDDNAVTRAKHIYYIPWDREQNQPAIETPGGGTSAQLDYSALVGAGAIDLARVTGSAPLRHHSNPHFIRGADGPGNRGVVLVDGVDALSPSGHTVLRLTLRATAALSTIEPVTGLGEAGDDIRLLAAHHSEKAAAPQPIVLERAVAVRSSTLYVDTDQFAAVPGAGDSVVVTHTPGGYAASCWDRNVNAITDSDEDRNQDGAWDTLDCHPSSIDDLFIEFDGLALVPQLEDGDGNPMSPGGLLTALSKELQLDVRYVDGRAFVRVAVTSPLSDRPLPAGELAVLSFARPSGLAPQVPFAAVQQVGLDELLVKDLTGAAPPVVFEAAGLFERVEDAAFAPAGDRLLLAAISHTRPTLLRTDGLVSATGTSKLLSTPTRVRGLDWEQRDRFMACNWVGGVQHPITKAMLSGFRGGLDELKTWRGLRDPDAFRSEAERGHEFLAATGQDGTLASKLPTCSESHQDCPDYHLCVEKQCRLVPCDPLDPYSCSATGGRCTLRPLGVEQEFSGPKGKDLFSWVCAADCDLDAQCFTEQCLNGPCRFCDDASLTCIECRDSVKQLGALSIESVEGCPDQRSFRCDAGACISDCYAFEDGESVYLCDSTTEFCQEGSCVLHDWTWWDLAPGSLAGSGEMRQAIPAETGLGAWRGYTQAVDQRIPIAVTAFGAGDLGAPPEVVVEVKGGPFYAEWQHIGVVTVHAETELAARQAPAVIVAPHPFTDLRLRLVTSPYDNAIAGATGLGAKDKDFCPADLAAASGGGAVDTTVCDRRPPGSRSALGYELEIAPTDAIRACQKGGGPGCPFAGNGELDYLRGGAPAAVIADVQVRGASVMNAISANTVCAYGGYGQDRLLPTDTDGVKKLFYGDIATERSPERDAFCAQPGADCTSPGTYGLIDFPTDTKGFALLNCNVVDPSHQGETASVTFANIPIVTEWPARAGAIVLDTGDACRVEVTPELDVPCHAWAGGDASFDPVSHPATFLGSGVTYGLLDVTWLRSFGHGDGFQAVPIPQVGITLQVDGYAAGTAPLQIRCPGGVVSPPGTSASQTFACPGTSSIGSSWSLAIIGQPSIGTVCTFDLGALETSGYLGKEGSTATIQCSTRSLIGATVAGLEPGGTLTLRGVFSDDGKSTSAVLDYVRTDNGPFALTALPPGGEYRLSVRSAPSGAVCVIVGATGTVGDSAPPPLAITCKAAAAVAMRVSVSGLPAAATPPLVVRSTPGGAPLNIGADGDVEFPDPVLEGTDYDVRIDAVPEAVACNVTAGGKGTVPGEPFIAAVITCTELETYTIGGLAVGLTGPGLQLALNGGMPITVSYVPGALTPVEFAFEARLTEGESYEVTLEALPQGPPTTCVVANGTGVVSGEAPEPVAVICQGALSAESYAISGTTSGLKGNGLRLKFAGSSVVADVAPTASGASPWTMPAKQPDGATFEVVVDRQPSAPTQYCEVHNGAGVVAGAGVSGIAVDCVDAAIVAVQAQLDGAEGAAVAARLYSLPGTAPSRLLAVAPKSAKIKKGMATFLMAELVPDDNEQPVTAHVPPGSYALVVMVNADGDNDTSTGLPRFNPGDPGAYRVVTASSTSTAPVVFDALELASVASVTLLGEPLGPAGARCFWHVGPVLATPVTLTAPVIATTTLTCAPPTDETTCENGGITRKQGAVWPMTVAGVAQALWPYTVSCWSDVDENGQMSPGDLFGSSPIWNPWALLNGVSLSVVSP
ncbi:MAG: hypothetical protein IV100_08665 [Myxococcales bacterium]|nr:hypothetical protein [Myxococcales bacterium]